MGHFLIFGGTGGIGSAVARSLAAEGHTLRIAARHEGRLSELSTTLGCCHSVVDVTDMDAVASVFSEATEQSGPIDGVANCVGSVLLKPAHLTSSNDWQTTIAQNLTSAFAIVRAAGKTMSRNGGSVVLMSSAAASIGLASHEAIAAAKAGVEGLVKSAATTYASKSLRFNAVAPGLVKTPLTERIWNSDRAPAASIAMHPAGRQGEPEDVARMIVFLLRNENDWITGQTFGVDGGLGTLKAQVRT